MFTIYKHFLMQEFNIFTDFIETQQVIFDSKPLKKESPHFLLDVQLLTLFPVCGLITCNAHCGTVTEEEKTTAAAPQVGKPCGLLSI